MNATSDPLISPLAGASNIQWTNPSVLLLASGSDPVKAVSEAARSLVLQGIDKGWTGPPYDPFELAHLLGILVRPANLRSDARTVIDATINKPIVEYNPSRPGGRVRYSVAHELGHLLFPDFSERVRQRTSGGAVAEWTKGDDWQLELLCNIAAAEILMPSQTLRDLGIEYIDISHLMAVRSRLAVSSEALLRRVVAMASTPVTMFAARRVEEGAQTQLSLDYTVDAPVGAALRNPRIPADSSLWDCTAIGHTVSERERWEDTDVQIEAVGVSPYPGQRYPRIAGLLVDPVHEPERTPTFREVAGNVFPLPEHGKQMVLHLVTNGARSWSGPFAGQLASELPAAARQFESWARTQELPLPLGHAQLLDSLTGPAVCCLIAQEGYGPSAVPRIRYPELAAALDRAGQYAVETGSSVHAPPLGTGQAQGHWPIIRDQIDRSIARRGVEVTIHHLDGV